MAHGLSYNIVQGKLKKTWRYVCVAEQSLAIFLGTNGYQGILREQMKWEDGGGEGGKGVGGRGRVISEWVAMLLVASCNGNRDSNEL